MKNFIRPVCALALLGLIALPLKAQTQPQQSVGFLDVGSEKERVLRVLQILGDVPLYPWSIRQLSPSEQDRLRPKTTAAMALLPAESRVRTFGALKVKVLPIEAQAIYNSAFPYGFNDGPIWAGKGLTGALSGGVTGRIGPLSFQLEPMVFEAQNQPFLLMPNGVPSNPFLNAFYPGIIDLPQRFGDKAYKRFDFGQSTARIEAGPLFVDLSTADQWWGPVVENPLILGNNAPGFLHTSVGTSHPMNLGIGQIHGRLVYGRLDQSAYSPDQGTDSIRFMSGVVALFTPRGVRGLEIGGARFFHSPWPTGGFARGPLSRPLEGLLKHSLASANNPTGQDADNQLASVFARWAFPSSGVEVYGEYGREDHNVDLRDLWQEPDHDAGYTLGMQRAWQSSPHRLILLRGELMNSRLSALNQGRAQAPWYVHQTLTQGHTSEGQLLGAPGGLGGSGVNLALDSYSAQGKWAMSWNRISNTEARQPDGSPNLAGADVTQSFGLERLTKLRSGSLLLRARFVSNLNRYFVSDRFSLNLTAGFIRTWQ